MVNLSLFDVLTVCFDEIDDKDLFLENKGFFVEGLKGMLLNESSDFFISITKGTSGKWAKDTRLGMPFIKLIYCKNIFSIFSKK
jgi:hypothetical protein